jgi:hypothetical protein
MAFYRVTNGSVLKDVYNALIASGITPSSQSKEDILSAITTHKGFTQFSCSWYGHYQHRNHNVSIPLDRPCNVTASLSSGIGGVGVCGQYMSSGQTVTINNVSTITVGDGNYPQDSSEGLASVTIKRIS